MALSNGPNLGILVDGGIGEVHYDALMQQWRAMDALVQPRVKSAAITTPPVSPADGDCYIVPSGATGVWSGNTNKIARYSSKQTAWEYYTPKNGWVVHNEATSSFIKFNGTVWVDPIINKADLVDGKVPASQLPSYVDDILEFPNLASFPVTGESGKIYVAIDTGNGYRWSGSTYVKVSQPLEEIPQATIEAGTDSNLFALTARRVRQAITAWWASITNIDGKNIGATTAGTGRFTTLTATGTTTLSGNLSCASTISSSFRVETVTSGATSSFVRAAATGTGEAGFLFDGSNGDFAGSDYGWLKQKDNLNVELASLGGPLVLAAGSSSQERVRIDNTTGTVRPGADNTQSLGEASFVWSAVHTSGVSFPATQNASANANTLDDYEEGTFTPTVAGTTTTGAGTYTTQVGRYTKIGNRVLFVISLNWTAHTGTGDMRIDGLPFTPGAMGGSYPVLSVNFSNLNFTAGSQVSAIVNVSSAQILLRQTAPNAAVTTIPMDTSAEFFVSGHYEV